MITPPPAAHEAEAGSALEFPLRSRVGPRGAVGRGGAEAAAVASEVAARPPAEPPAAAEPHARRAGESPAGRTQADGRRAPRPRTLEAPVATRVRGRGPQAEAGPVATTTAPGQARGIGQAAAVGTPAAAAQARAGPTQAARGRSAPRQACLRDRQRGRGQRLLDQPGRTRGVPRLRRDPAEHDLDRPQAPGSARRAGQDRAAIDRRRALSARRQRQAAQGVARGRHRELRQLCRRRPEHGERAALAARLGPEPVDRPADRRSPQGERRRSRTASSCSRSRGSAR